MNQTEQKRKERRKDVDKVLFCPKRPFLSTDFRKLKVYGIVNIAGGSTRKRTKTKRQKEARERERERERLKNKKAYKQKQLKRE